MGKKPEPLKAGRGKNDGLKIGAKKVFGPVKFLAGISFPPYS
jgi:hypothetical protein